MAEILEKKKANLSACLRRRSRQSQPKKSNQTRVRLEQVLGVTASCSSLSSTSELLAYPAGCVVVLLNPKENKQSHIINSTRKPFSALSFSHDGKLLVTGESGHMPCVRVWELDGTQTAEVQSHKYGVSCVAFSTNDQFIVSVGYQHDMTVSVWDWRKGAVIASNKVSSRVSSVSFSDDSSCFVTAGNRHLKFWYLQESAERRVNSTVPLIGRSGLLGEYKTSVFSGVACGRGIMSHSTFCISRSGLLFVFNARRTMDAWLHLKTSCASCLCVSEEFVFCGCSDGIIRVFSPNLTYITTLQRPHRLGVELQHSPLSPGGAGAQFPDTVALTFDPGARLLSVVYSDHSVYSWDLTDLKSCRRVFSGLFHSSCVWSHEVYPDLDLDQACLPPSAFLSCSSDNTIRVWTTDRTQTCSLYSQDLLRILYVGENSSVLQVDSERPDAAGADGKSGLRVLGISPDGAHLATGDRHGNLRVFALDVVTELLKIEAHDSEVLCLEFSPLSSGVSLLASASRDRLIHIFNRDQDYSLIQTLNNHSASITAVRFTGDSPDLKMVSCGADKSLYVQTAEQTEAGLIFSRSHHMVEKTTLYDMDLDQSRTHAVLACQDRNIRVYSVESGKLTKTLKGTSSDEGALLKVHLDPSGSFVATSCSDKNICIFDYDSGECVATLFGHSEIVTSMRFSQDCRHLITASGDSCIFVWRLDSNMTLLMRRRRGLKKQNSSQNVSRKLNIRRETFITVPPGDMTLLPEGEESDTRTPGRIDTEHGDQLLQTNGKLPMWFRKLQGEGGAPSALDQSEAESRQVRGRWAEQVKPLKICSSFSPSPTQSQDEERDLEPEEEEEFCPQSLESLLMDEEEEQGEEPPGVVRSSFSLYPSHSCASERDCNVQGLVKGQGEEPVWSELSPDSACSDGSTESTDQPQDPDADSLSQGSSVGSSVGSLVLDEDDRSSLKNHFETLTQSLGAKGEGYSDEHFDTDLKTLQPPDQKHFLNPRLSISSRFLSRFQDRLRSKTVAVASVPSRILEESSLENSQVKPQTNSYVSKESSVKREARRHSDVSIHNTSLPGTTAQQGIIGNGGRSSASMRKNPSQNSGKENLNPDQDREQVLTGPGLAACGGSEETIFSLSARSHNAPLPLAPPPHRLTPGISGGDSAEETLVLSPTLSLTPIPFCDQLEGSAICEVICPALSSQRDQSGGGTGAEPEDQTPAVLIAEITSCSAPECDRLLSFPGEEQVTEQSVSLEQVQQAADELRRAAERAAQLLSQVQSVPGLAAVLSDAFKAAASLHAAPPNSAPGDPCGHGEDCSRTQSLLEKYSDLLLKMTLNKLSSV